MTTITIYALFRITPHGKYRESDWYFVPARCVETSRLDAAPIESLFAGVQVDRTIYRIEPDVVQLADIQPAWRSAEDGSQDRDD